ncbi:MAG: hypothetical protein JW863_11205 [Chitinispirillaceae bacterium]|nr:hypothetical protein [Chitinispirillaceae bacterium]
MRKFVMAAAVTCLTLQVAPVRSAEIPADVKALLDAEMAAAKPLSTDAVIVAAVKKYNEGPASSMTNEAWKKLTLLSPEVKALIKSDIGQYLKKKKTAVITEMFLNGADGGKVAFLSKTTSWNHKGKAKHDEPMKGNTWIGPVEVDESSGEQQIQIAIPVLEGEKPVGSLVIGFGVSQMKYKTSK